MKKLAGLILVVVVVSMFLGCAGMHVVPPEDRVVQHVHEVDMPKGQIFCKCLEWMVQRFVGFQEVIVLKDKENGKIIGRGMTEFKSGGIVTIPCRFTMMVEAKDNKYRVTYNNWVGMWGEYRNMPMELKHKKYVDQVRQRLSSLDADLYAYLKASKKSDW